MADIGDIEVDIKLRYCFSEQPENIRPVALYFNIEDIWESFGKQTRFSKYSLATKLPTCLFTDNNLCRRWSTIRKLLLPYNIKY